jgi:hypothetical protein
MIVLSLISLRLDTNYYSDTYAIDGLIRLNKFISQVPIIYFSISIQIPPMDHPM